MTSLAHTQAGAPARVRALWMQRGFTLVELMISMVIGLFIVLALLTLLINVNRNNNEMVKTNRVIENGRFALQLLQADVSHAGFWGGFVPAFDDLTNQVIPGDVPTAVPDPCLATGLWDTAYKSNIIGLPVQAWEIPSVVPSPTVPGGCAAKVALPQPKTDVLVVRHLETCKSGVDSGCAAPTASDLYFQLARCNDPSSVNYTTSTYILGTVTLPYPPATPTVATSRFKGNCVNTADLFKYVSNIYYVRNYAVTPGDGVPTLMRSQFTGGSHQTAEAMIEGVEGFRVEFGLDSASDAGTTVTYTTGVTWANSSLLTSPTNRGDGIPESYVHCTAASPCTPAQLMNAVSAKVYVLVRSEVKTPNYTDNKTYNLGSTTLGPFTDSYKRHLFTQTVRLVNVSSRRETPP
jgi:type IV pilus assembly protein PilW